MFQLPTHEQKIDEMILCANSTSFSDFMYRHSSYDPPCVRWVSEVREKPLQSNAYK